MANDEKTELLLGAKNIAEETQRVADKLAQEPQDGRYAERYFVHHLGRAFLESEKPRQHSTVEYVRIDLYHSQQTRIWELERHISDQQDWLTEREQQIEEVEANLTQGEAVITALKEKIEDYRLWT